MNKEQLLKEISILEKSGKKVIGIERFYRFGEEKLPDEGAIADFSEAPTKETYGLARQFLDGVPDGEFELIS